MQDQYNGNQAQMGAPTPQEPQEANPMQLTPEDAQRLKAVLTPENVRPLVLFVNSILAAAIQGIQQAELPQQQAAPASQAPAPSGVPPLQG